MKVAILTCSDRCFAGASVDESGHKLQQLCEENGQQVVARRCVPDDLGFISNTLVELCDTSSPDILLTTGGTGLSPRDVTPEATRKILHREAPGIVVALIQKSLQKTNMAMLSRLVAGVRNNTLIINFPGSVRACSECYEIVKPVLEHAAKLLQNDQLPVSELHHQMKMEHHSIKSKVRLVPSAQRHRQSPYPMIDFNKAIEIICNESQPSGQIELVKVNDYKNSVDRVLAVDVEATYPLPPFPASIKDGYAVLSGDGSGLRKVLPLSIAAGRNYGDFVLESGQCVRINTGAPVPKGADAVVQIEDTSVVETSTDGEESVIEIKTTPSVSQDIRKVGSDIEADSTVVKAHTKLGAIELGLLATVGRKHIEVYKKPVVGVLSTGDELLDVGEPYKDGAIWDANRVTLSGLFHHRGFKAHDFGIVKDEPDNVVMVLQKAFSTVDVLVTTGGVSMGEKDIIKLVLEQDFEAKIHFARVNIKPGKPTTFATCTWQGKRKLIFALPGNPVSAFVTCFLFCVPSLELLSRAKTDECKKQLKDLHKTVSAKLECQSPIQLDPRPEFLRGVLRYDDDGLKAVPLTGGQQSSRLLSVKTADVLIQLPKRQENVAVCESGFNVTAFMVAQ